jgi:hypothetical protein
MMTTMTTVVMSKDVRSDKDKCGLCKQADVWMFDGVKIDVVLKN